VCRLGDRRQLGRSRFFLFPPLYPLSAFRAMSKAALNVYQHLLDDGTQKKVVDSMQTRMELYDFLGYHDYEKKLDQLFDEEQS